MSEKSHYASLIRSCTDLQVLSNAKNVHALIAASAQAHNRYLANLLINMYAKCGSPTDALAVFGQIAQPNVFSWNLLLAAFARNGHMHESRKIFESIPHPDSVSWNTIISVYTSNGEMSEARALFDRSPCKNTVSWNSIISGYADSGYLSEAKSLFDRIPEPNAASWNAMLGAYARTAHVDEARDLFERMPVKNVVAWTTMVAMFAQNGDLDRARECFEKMPERNVVSWTTMVQAYAQNDQVDEAKRLFDRTPSPNTISWNVMLLAYSQSGHLEQAERLFKEMPNPNTVSWNAMIQAYISHDRDLQRARDFFERMPAPDVVSWTAMVSAYAKSGNASEARSLFDRMPVKNTVSWNTMISAYAENGLLVEAEKLFSKMPARGASTWTSIMAAYSQNSMNHRALQCFALMDLDGVSPDLVAYSTALSVCSALRSLERGKEIHSSFVASGLEPDQTLGNTLVDFYSRCGCMERAQQEFDRMPKHDITSWTLLVAGYTINGRAKKSIRLFAAMDQAGFHPDNFSFVAAFEACGSLASLALVKILHETYETSRNEPDLVLENSLIDLYSKCAHLEGSKTVFDGMKIRDLVSWSTMITAFVQSGLPQEALDLFMVMISEGFEPDYVNFITVLTACSHLGELKRALDYFASITVDHHVDLAREHYHCVIDLLARAGKLKEAEDLIKSMPFEPSEVAWMSLLSSCRTHRESSRRAVAMASKLFPEKDSSSYVMLSNICL